MLHMLAVMATAARDERPEVNGLAVDALQRALVLPALRAMDGHGWEAVLTTVLLPLVTDLTSSSNDSEFLQRAFSMCTKAFLQYVLSCVGKFVY